MDIAAASAHSSGGMAAIETVRLPFARANKISALRPISSGARSVCALLALPAAAADGAPAYVGSAACAGCHAAETAAWQGSHHALAWTLPSEATVLGDFDDASFEHGGVTARFFREGGGWFIEAEDGDGRAPAPSRWSASPAGTRCSST